MWFSTVTIHRNEVTQNDRDRFNDMFRKNSTKTDHNRSLTGDLMMIGADDKRKGAVALMAVSKMNATLPTQDCVVGVVSITDSSDDVYEVGLRMLD